jgi:hypothetical protein
MQASRNGNDLWLTYWVDTSTGTNNTRFYLVTVLSVEVNVNHSNQYVNWLLTNV